MVKISKVFKLLIVLFLVSLLSISTVYASGSTEGVSSSGSDGKTRVEVTLTDDQTGETQIIDSSIVKKEETSIGVDYDVFVPLESSDNLITPLTIGSGGKTSGGVTANLSVDYNWNSSKGYLRINRVFGNWKPSSAFYSVSNRKVIAHNGAIGSRLKKLSKYPGTNSFSYTTGWGYTGVVTGNHGAMAQSTATTHVYGMSGTHTLSITVWVPN